MKHFLFLSAVVYFISLTAIQSQVIDHNYFNENIEIYFKFEISSPQILRTLTNVVSIDNVESNTVYAYANEKEYSEFLTFGIEHTILQRPGTLIIPNMSDDLDEISDWDTYPTYDGYVNMMNQFASNYPSICQLIDAGTTVQGRKILFVKISDNVSVRESEPQFLYTSSIHGDETTGYVLMLRLIDSLLTTYGTNSRITSMINNAEIWINPNANPDGTYHGGNGTVNGATRYNANSYDLNRNFPDPEYGIHPNEQPETAIFRDIAEQNNFVLNANFHGGAEVVNYPWDTWSNGYPDYVSHPDEDWYQFISHHYADTCQAHSPSNYMNGFDDGITNGGAWYVIHGGRQDYMNWFMKSREVTIEISDTKLLPASLLPAHWVYNKRSFLNYLESIFYGVRGIVTDTSGNPLNAMIKVLNHDTLNSEIRTDSLYGNYYRMLASGNYSLLFTAAGHFPKTIENVNVSNFQTTILNVELIPNPVPIELVLFTAKENRNNVDLNWATATELNNSGFEIERALINLKSGIENPQWTKIGFVNGHGTTTEPQFYSFTDESLQQGKYQYRLKQIDFDGSFEYSKVVEVTVEGPSEFSLSQNYPNPFNPTTKIKYSIPSVGTQHAVSVQLKVYDVLGNEVATLVNDEKPAGEYEVKFDGSELTSGIYFFQLKAGSYIQTKKMILMK